MAQYHNIWMGRFSPVRFQAAGQTFKHGLAVHNSKLRTANTTSYSDPLIPSNKTFFKSCVFLCVAEAESGSLRAKS